ncbi:GNAT family N-acetyltransferase [Priestia sp. YIM B13489]|uniref:GNAT family N-acetyltransferase n=1 Tax=Priestia sp. YIM B13489 TaxID=3366313 RepID=UPI00366D6C51
MNIYNEDLILRAIELEDMELLKSMINNPNIENMVLGWSFPVSSNQQINWINNLKGDKNNVRFIVDINNIGAVGLVSLTNIDYKNGTATINIKLNSDEIKQKGIGYKAIILLSDYAFNQLNLNCLIANILNYNIASQKLFEKCRFTLEGKLQGRIYKNGAYQDVYSYSLLKRDFINERNR